MASDIVQKLLCGVVKLPFICNMFFAAVAEFRVVGAGEGVSEIVDLETGQIPPENGLMIRLFEETDDLPSADAETVTLGPVIHVMPHVGKLVEVRHDAANLEGKTAWLRNPDVFHHKFCIFPVVDGPHVRSSVSSLAITSGRLIII